MDVRMENLIEYSCEKNSGQNRDSYLQTVDDP